jgi:pyridoxal biosynthesis lyase PdxS
LATTLKVTVPEHEVINSGVSFIRSKGRNKHGELTIRQNHIDWKPKGNEKVFSVTWEQFADFAEQFQSKQPKVTAVKAKKRLRKTVSE